jgi:ParB family transcriptional regulator, chromosome partitioning protein
MVKMAEDKPQRLGRGLAALMGDMNDVPAVSRGTRRVPMIVIKLNYHNPRKHFNEEQLKELADSIRERGIIQPLVVRSLGGVPETFDLIAGERRYQAAGLAGLTEVPVHVIDATDREAREIAMIENLQRVDLNFIEEGMGYQDLIDKYGYSIAELSRVMGKSRSHVSNGLRMLALPPQVRSYVLDGKLSASHARASLAYDDPLAAANEMLEKGLSVREAEAITPAQMDRVGQAVMKKLQPAEKNADIREVENDLSGLLGLGVQINQKGAGGELRIKYQNLEQLEGVLHLLKR